MRWYRARGTSKAMGGRALPDEGRFKGPVLWRKRHKSFAETETSITNKLKRGTFCATFFLRVLRR